MTPQFLTVKIQSILGGNVDASDMQKRSVAMEYYRLCSEAESQLEHCVALIRAGRDYPALQVAESSNLLDSLNALMFSEAAQWRAYCASSNLPVPPPFDDNLISLVNSLYSSGVSQSHPLYRDYRRAMRLRKYSEALAIIKTISKINSYDADARRECDRLRKRVCNRNLDFLERALGKNDDAEISRLYEILKPDAELVSDSPVWAKAAARRRELESGESRARCMEILRELQNMDIGADFAKAGELVTEFNLIRDDADFVESDLALVEKISAETAEKQNQIIAAEKAARARNLIGIEIENPEKGESRRDKLARICSLIADAGKTLDPDTERRIRKLASRLRLSLRLSALLRAGYAAAGCAAIAALAYFGWNFYRDSAEATLAESEITDIEQLSEPSEIYKKIGEFKKSHSEKIVKRLDGRIAALNDTAKVAEIRRKKVAESLAKLEALDFNTAPSQKFDAAKLEIERLYTEIPGLSAVRREGVKSRLEEVSKRMFDSVDARKMSNLAVVRTNLDKYEKIAEEYENFSRALPSLDADTLKITKVLRPILEDTSSMFTPHRLDVDKFNDISARISDAKSRYVKFDKMKESLSTARNASEYLAAVAMLVESGTTPAEFAKKLSRISETKDAISYGQLVDFGSREAIDNADSAGNAVRASFPQNKMLTDVYRYSRGGKLFVYTIGKMSERKNEWSGGSEILQEVDEIGAGGNVSKVSYRKHFISGRNPRGEILSEGTIAPESYLGAEVFKTSAEKSMLEAVSLIGNSATSNSIYRAFLEGMIFAKMSANPCGSLLEYSPLAKVRKEAVERYSRALFDYSWIFESNSKTRLVAMELYSKPAPNYLEDAKKYLNAIKIARESPLMLIGVCDENGKPTTFKDAKGAIWSVNYGSGKFCKIGGNLAECSGLFAPLAPVFSEVKSSKQILSEAEGK